MWFCFILFIHFCLLSLCTEIWDLYLARHPSSFWGSLSSGETSIGFGHVLPFNPILNDGMPRCSVSMKSQQCGFIIDLIYILIREEWLNVVHLSPKLGLPWLLFPVEMLSHPGSFCRGRELVWIRSQAQTLALPPSNFVISVNSHRPWALLSSSVK